LLKNLPEAENGMVGREDMLNELERRAQIEETWARRCVYADSMAQERMAEYVARRDLARLGSYGYPEPAPPRRPTARPVAQPARGFSLPAFPARPVAIAHYARSASPDSMAALMAGLRNLSAPAYAGRSEPRREQD
jgi:hypothetical protein